MLCTYIRYVFDDVHLSAAACTERVSGVGSPVGSPAFGGAPLALEQGLADRRRLALVLVLRREEVRHLAPRREKRCCLHGSLFDIGGHGGCVTTDCIPLAHYTHCNNTTRGGINTHSAEISAGSFNLIATRHARPTVPAGVHDACSDGAESME